jgi:magnesium transporter
MVEQDVEVTSEKVEDLLRGEALEEAVSLIASIHPADQAELFTRLEPDLRPSFLALLSAEGQAHLLEHLEPEERQEVVEDMPRASLARVLDRIDNDVAADILRGLAPSEAARVISTMTTAGDVAPLLEHADESAGGLMTRGFVALHGDMTAQDAINYMRLLRPNVEEAYYLYVMDAANHLEGVVSLRELVVAAPDTPLRKVMESDVIAVGPEKDQEEVARLVQHYRLRALPVVDEERHLLGITTMDDAMDVVAEEATEDMYRMAGVGVDERAFSPLRESAARRIPWLAFNMVWAFAGAAIISVFQGTIDKIASVVIFMPMIAGQGGNAGIQTATIVIRSMALGEVQVGDVARLLAKEWTMGVIKGVIFGLALGLVAWAWKDNATLGMVAGLALFLNMLVAATGGVLIPITMRRLGLDPATIAGVFDTMLTDFMGFLIYLGLATLLVTQLT